MSVEKKTQQARMADAAGRAVLAILASVTVCAAQQATPPPATLRLNANLVLVDVVVTNRGAAVQGLDRRRFHLFEDGREQRIVAFDEHGPEPPATEEPAIAKPPLPAHVYSNLSAVANAGALNVFLLDDLNTPVESREFLRQQLREYVAKKPADTTLMVFTLGSQLRLLQGVTNDAVPLTKVLQNTSADNIPLESLRIAPQITVAALLELARYLQTVPGRKNLIWFAGAFPIASDPGAALSSARVAVYPVNAKGLDDQPLFSASFADLGAAGRANRAFYEQMFDEHTAMREMARQTGGTAFVDTNGFADLVAKTIENGSRYYTIGYAPTEKQLDAKFRKLEVRLDGSSVDLAYRRGYYAGKPAANAAMKAGMTNALASNLPGTPVATQITFQARVLPASAPELAGKQLPEGSTGELSATLRGPANRYVVDLLIDPHELRFQQTNNQGHAADLELNLAAYSENTRLLNYTDRHVKLELKPDRYARTLAEGLPLRLAIDLPEGQLALRIAVRDALSGAVGSLEVPLTVGAP